MNIIKGLIIIMLCTIFLLNSCYNPNLSESNYEEIKSDLICEECNVIIIVIDALRPDHLGCYGYIRETSPNIDSLCKKSIVFENAIAQSTWTKPSVTSLFVSNYVQHHKIPSGSPYYGDNDNSSFLPDSALTIAKVLSSYEYKTKALTSNLFIQRSFGLEQGFDEYILTENDKEITKNTIEWISQNKDNKIFLYLHYMAPHGDYDPPAKDRLFFKKDYSGSINFAGKHQKYFNSEVKMSDEDIEELVARYDGEIRFIDREIQKILTSLNSLVNFKGTTLLLLCFFVPFFTFLLFTSDISILSEVI